MSFQRKDELQGTRSMRIFILLGTELILTKHLLVEC